MILHTFNSPEAFARHNQSAAFGDQLLLVEDGVFCLADKALEEDLALRGIMPVHAVNLISYHQWVSLVAQSQHTLTWT